MPASAVPTDLITLHEAAELVGCGHLTIRRRVSDGTVPGYRVGKRALRVSRAEVLAGLVRRIPTASAR